MASNGLQGYIAHAIGQNNYPSKYRLEAVKTNYFLYIVTYRIHLIVYSLNDHEY